MLPLTLHTPKPLLRVADEPLIAWHIRRLAASGIAQLVINVSHLGEQIREYCGDGSTWGVNIRYSEEAEPLETAGGIIKALPLLGEQPFIVINSDIWTDFSFESLLSRSLPTTGGAHLVLVGNPDHHPEGDFALDREGRVQARQQDTAAFTFSGMGIYTREFFAGIEAEKFPLLPLFERAISRRLLSGQIYKGDWTDVGTPARLEQLNQQLAHNTPGL